MATHETSDESVVVVIGSGAGGGTLANELCQKGVPVVLLEAGKRQSTATYVNDEWASFGQLAWTDKRTTSGTDRKSTRLNSSHLVISYAVFCLKKKNKQEDVYY